MAEIYYPRLPWDDVPVAGDPINRDRITSEWLTRDGIYGPYDVIIRWLTARDNKKLIADTRVLCVEQTAQA